MARDSGGHRHVNEVGGTVSGPVIQARDFHGEVHVHGAGNPLPIPRQLPGTGILVNREKALAALNRALSGSGSGSGSGAVVVSGPAGIGKTALALHWAHDRLGEFPDGQLYADLQGHSPAGPARPAEILGRFIRALGVPGDRVPVEPAERAALFRSLSAGRRLLIVLDDAYSAAQVGPLLPGPPGSVAVVTSRWRLAGLLVRGARAVQLDVLAPDAALQLLDGVLGTERITREREMAGELVELCARSPLALSVAAARLATRPRWRLADLVRDLADEKRRLAVLSVPDTEDDVTIMAALELSYRGLPEPVRHLYRMLGLFPGTAFDARMAAALAGEPLQETRDRLGVLDDANLLADLPGDRYRLHDLARLHAQQTAGEHEEPIRRLADWTVTATLAAARACAPYRKLPEHPVVPPGPPEFGGMVAALDWLDDEFGNLRSIVRRARESGLDRAALLIVDAAWPLFLHRGHHTERLDFDRLGLEAARARGDRYAEAKMLNRTGLALRALGRPGEAADDFRAALDLWNGLGERSRAAGTRRRLGLLELDRDRLGAAAAHFAVALEEYRAAGEDRRAALTLCDLGTTLLRDGHPDRAVEALTEAERLLATTANDAYNQARVLVLLGQAHAGGVRAPSAAAALASATALVTRGLEAMREIGSAVGEADALQALGDLAAAGGQATEARRHYESAREILVGAGAPTRTLDARLAGFSG